MKSTRIVAAVVSGLLVLATATSVLAWEGRGLGIFRRSPEPCWHSGYSYNAWGRPAALVVPPNADYQTHWGWGVGNTRITRIRPQFQRDWPGAVESSGGAFQPTPPWPSDTDQSGVYYVRGPW